MADENLQIKISTEYDGKGAKTAEKDLKGVSDSAKNTGISVKNFRFNRT